MGRRAHILWSSLTGSTSVIELVTSFEEAARASSSVGCCAGTAAGAGVRSAAGWGNVLPQKWTGDCLALVELVRYLSILVKEGSHDHPTGRLQPARQGPGVRRANADGHAAPPPRRARDDTR